MSEEPGTIVDARVVALRKAGGALAVILLVGSVIGLARSARPAWGSASPQATPSPTPTPPIATTYMCRRGAEFHVSPEEALVTINGVVIGKADDWDNAGGGKQWIFPRSGVYYARFTRRGFHTTWVKIVVDAHAEREIVKVKDKLRKR